MLGEVRSENFSENGKPAGGWVQGTGLSIRWQKEPLGRGENRQEPNGAFVETVIAAAKQRIEFYEEAGFGCPENRLAIAALQGALDVLDGRTKDREAQSVEGTHERRSVVPGPIDA